MLAQIGRFTSVGIAATFLHFLTALIAQYQFGLSAQLSNLAGFCAAFSLSYTGHSQFTFQVKGNHATHLQRFLLLSLGGLFLSASITHLVHVVFGASFFLAMLTVALCVPALTFVVSKYWAFSTVAPGNTAKALGFAAVLGLAALCFVIMQNQLLNHDTSWYLVATRKWLDGARLYVDLIEVNPPLNFYYTVPAIWVADATGMGDLQAQTLVTTGLMTASLLWVWHILYSTKTLNLRFKSAILAGSAVALFVPFLGDFAQREHAFVIFLLPYLIGLSFSVGEQRSSSPEMLRAFYAGFGLCLKPHFMLVPAAITVALCLRDRSLRPIIMASNWVIFAMGLGYVALVKSLHPEYLDEIVPMALQVYGAYGFSASKVIANANPGLLGLFCCLSFLVFRARQSHRFIPLLAGIFGCVLVYCAQWTGYGYQAAPFVALISLVCIWTLADQNFERSPHLLAATCLLIIAFDGVRGGTYRSPATEVLKPYVNLVGPKPRLAVFSSSLWPSFPLAIAADATWTSRYPALWLVPGAFNKLQSEECGTDTPACSEAKNILLRTRTNIVSDFIEGQADLLVVDNKPYYINDPSFNYIDFLSDDDRFKQHFQSYTRFKTTEKFSLYRKKAD